MVTLWRLQRKRKITSLKDQLKKDHLKLFKDFREYRKSDELFNAYF